MFGSGKSPQQEVRDERDAAFANSVIKGTWRPASEEDQDED
jgi:hypothetical protein